MKRGRGCCREPGAEGHGPAQECVGQATAWKARSKENRGPFSASTEHQSPRQTSTLGLSLPTEMHRTAPRLARLDPSDFSQVISYQATAGPGSQIRRLSRSRPPQFLSGFHHIPPFLAPGLVTTLSAVPHLAPFPTQQRHGLGQVPEPGLQAASFAPQTPSLQLTSVPPHPGGTSLLDHPKQIPPSE